MQQIKMDEIPQIFLILISEHVPGIITNGHGGELFI
jgi:hypothetical protein